MDCRQAWKRDSLPSIRNLEGTMKKNGTRQPTILRNENDLISHADRDSLTAWFNVYMEVDGSANADNTVAAKQADIQRFVTFFQEVARSDHCDGWTRSISEHFVKRLVRQPSERTGRPLSPTTINRILATLCTASRWIHQQRRFLAGPPMDRIRDIEVDQPEWNGLTPLAVVRLKTAAEQLIQIQRRSNQTPYRNFAILMVLLHTGLRQSELRDLDIAQYQNKHFHRVKRKGRKVTRKLLVAKPAREAIAEYFDHERGHDPGPLIQSKNGKPLSAQDLNAALSKIAGQANATLPAEEQISISAHMLRHTALKTAADRKDIRLALDMAGHSSERYIWRYTQLSDAEREDAIESLYE